MYKVKRKVSKKKYVEQKTCDKNGICMKKSAGV